VDVSFLNARSGRIGRDPDDEALRLFSLKPSEVGSKGDGGFGVCSRGLQAATGSSQGGAFLLVMYSSSSSMRAPVWNWILLPVSRVSTCKARSARICRWAVRSATARSNHDNPIATMCLVALRCHSRNRRA